MASVNGIAVWPEGGLLYHWFTRYNPMYFFSALCVLGGVYLLTCDLPDWEEGQVALFAVIQLYEALLLVGAGLLFRVAGQRRPAVLLALIGVVFLLDPSLRIEGLSMEGSRAIALLALWSSFAILKLAMLRVVFRLHAAPGAWVLPVVAATGIASVPGLIAADVMEPDRALVTAAWVGAALVGLAIWQRPVVRCHGLDDEWGLTVLARIVRSAPFVWAGFYLYHLAMWTGIYDVGPGAEMAAPFLVLVPFAFRRELDLWAICIPVLGIGFIDPGVLSETAIALGVVLAWLGQRHGMPRLYVLAVLCAYLGIWTFDLAWMAMPEPDLALNLITAGTLVALAWHYQMGTAIAGAVVVLTPGAGEFLPQSAAQWGATLIVFGFVALLAGFAFDWWRLPASRVPREE